MNLKEVCGDCVKQTPKRYKQLIERALSYDESGLSFEGVLHAIERGVYRLVEIRRGRRLQGICIYTHTATPFSTSLYIVALAGNDFAAWQKDLEIHLMKRAYEWRVTFIEFYGRKGWQKALELLGFGVCERSEKGRVGMKKRVKHGRF